MEAQPSQDALALIQTYLRKDWDGMAAILNAYQDGLDLIIALCAFAAAGADQVAKDDGTTAERYLQGVSLRLADIIAERQG
jgi:hypothetical protein